MATARLSQELEEIHRDPPGECTAGPIDGNLFHWKATIFGPPGSVFEGGVFNLDLQFPSNYPNDPPNIRFKTKIYHCNIYNDGRICLNLLDKSNGWNSSFSVSMILLAICAMLTNPNPDHPTNKTIANQYKNDRAAYDQEARNWTKKYACFY